MAEFKLQRNKQGNIIRKDNPKSKEHALEMLKSGFLVNTTDKNPNFVKRELFKLVYDLISEEPKEYPVNWISVLNSDITENGYQCLIPQYGSSSGKGAIYESCKSSLPAE